MDWFHFVLLSYIPIMAGILAWGIATILSKQRYEEKDWAYWLLPAATYSLLFHLVAYLVPIVGNRLLSEFPYNPYADAIVFIHGGLVAGRLKGILQFPLIYGAELSSFGLTLLTIATLTPWAYVLSNLERLRFLWVITYSAMLFFALLNRFEGGRKRVGSGGVEK